MGIMLAAALWSCSDEDIPYNPTTEVCNRTVLVYISGETNLDDIIDSELYEMKEGSRLIGNNALLVYIDRAKKDELPYLARIKQGEIIDSTSIADMGISTKDEYSSDPNVMEGVIRYAFNTYKPVQDEYGLVLWGHASGWLLEDSVVYSAMGRRRAYGVDNGINSGSSTSGKWLNMPTLAKVLSKLPHLNFIFADCCNFQCLESAYELRNVTDYIIGSAAEIPDVGAPYNTVVPAMFDANFQTAIVDSYYAQTVAGCKVPLSVIKTEGMEELASVTRSVLGTFAPELGQYPDMTGIIHYYYAYKFFDANDFIREHASAADYANWKQAFDKVVVHKQMATQWLTNRNWGSYYNDFTVTEEKFGGVSMHIPQSPSSSNYSRYNADIKHLGWYYAAGYADIGW